VKFETRVLIIGGGATGTGLARDLALRGVTTLLVEKRDIAVGASGGNHGLLHSGGRYVCSDPQAARECSQEGALLKKVAPHVIEDTGGLFVAVPGDDEKYIAAFPDLCDKSGVPFRSLRPREARELEPAVAPDCIAAYEVQDAAIDPFMLCLDNMAHACSLGGGVLRNARVTSFIMEQGKVRAVRGVDDSTGTTFEIQAEVVVNASGAWAGIVAGMAGVSINVLYSMGSLVVTQDRIARRVINRLRKASDSDILVPGGTVSILGTTSERIDDPDQARPTVAEVDRMIEEGARMVPVLRHTRYMRAYAGVRPLVSLKGGAGDDRDVSRGFVLLDHAPEGIENFITITGGKLTTFRLMAEKTADLVCAKLGVTASCRTRTEPLPPSGWGRWAEPGRSARAWIEEHHAEDVILCECEMVSANVVDALIQDMGAGMRGRSLLKAVSQRSRVGKGPCQGGFCGPRVTAHLYDTDVLHGERGLHELKHFIERRWRGKAPVLWGAPLMQAELQEAVHCNILDLELLQGPDWS
jgi:glycerol-3-phosphate dehydrogenase